MGAAGKYLRKITGGYLFWCPGCDQAHQVNVERDGAPKWTFNGDLERPTFAPSILCFTTYDENDDGDVPKPLPEGQRRTLCHSFVTDGQIIFCGDSPHHLSGQTVPLPEFPSPDKFHTDPA